MGRPFSERTFTTEDGYVLRWEDGFWTDGDLRFGGDMINPVNDLGEKIYGTMELSHGPATYETMKSGLEDVLRDFKILCGDIVGPSGFAWQDVARIASEHLDNLSKELLEASRGNHEGGLAFPSPEEAMETATEEAATEEPHED